MTVTGRRSGHRRAFAPVIRQERSLLLSFFNTSVSSESLLQLSREAVSTA